MKLHLKEPYQGQKNEPIEISFLSSLKIWIACWAAFMVISFIVGMLLGIFGML